MTIRGIGKPVPSQRFLLRLAGVVVEGRGRVLEPSQAQVRRSQEEGYKHLKRLTGQDFGLDVQRWFAYLATCRDHGITHPYGYGATRRILKELGYDSPCQKDID
jgi:hypothetical protein